MKAQATCIKAKSVTVCICDRYQIIGTGAINNCTAHISVKQNFCD